MDSGIIKKYNRDFINSFPVTLPPMGWYFSSAPPKGSIELSTDKFTCMFEHIEDVVKGNKISFSKNSAGCSGAACYFGFAVPDEKAGRFLASKEKFKEKNDYGNQFYCQIKAKKLRDKYLILGNIEQIEDDILIEVVN